MLNKLKVERITPENFADYGTLVTASNKKPSEEFDTDLFNLYSHLASNDFEGEIIFNILEVAKRGKEFSELERHVNTEELFMALDRDVIVLVGKPDNNKDIPEVDTVRAFHMEAGEGMLMKKGTWHWIPYPFEDKTNMLVIFKKGTLKNDLVVVDLQEEKNVTFEIDTDD